MYSPNNELFLNFISNFSFAIPISRCDAKNYEIFLHFLLFAKFFIRFSLEIGGSSWKPQFDVKKENKQSREKKW
jgi:hypothetical protein